MDGTVPPDKRDAARETVARMLALVLRGHPRFAHLAVLVSRDARRGGWQVDVVVLDPALSPTGTDMPLDDGVLQGITAALARL